MPALLDESPAVAETRLVHEVHRRATALLADVLARPAGAVDDTVDDTLADTAELRDFVVAMLHHHHRSEDAALWPLLLSAAPELVEPLRALSAEHEHLDTALDALHALPISAATRDAAAERAAVVRDLVHEHLAHEEPVLFPALRAHVTDAAWTAFSAQTVATAPPEGTHLMVALLCDVGTSADVELIFQHLPPAARAAIPSQRAEGARAIAQLQGQRPASGYGALARRSP